MMIDISITPKYPYMFIFSRHLADISIKNNSYIGNMSSHMTTIQESVFMIVKIAYTF